ncbi:hypothetical protein [Acidithiobacillus ferridurans]|jgi:hypothetical protein|nr:hypothetical protein [Acidithiobacillus ferridurans]
MGESKTMLTSQPRDEAFLSSPAFTKALANDDGRAAKAHLAAGRPIYYGDERHPGKIIKEFPDGRRQLITISRTRQEAFIREL